MSYHHLTTFERGSIEALSKEGRSLRYIAAHLGRSTSTISRELRRCEAFYSAKYAHWHSCKLRERSRPKGKATPETISLIEQHFAMAWSPEQIAHTACLGRASTKTIYNWLYAGKLLNGDLRALRQKGKRRNPNAKPDYCSAGRSIDQRPKNVWGRKVFGHWELDTVWSCKGVSDCLATFLERKSRFYTAIRLPNKSSDSMKQAIEQLLEVLPKEAFLTATCDRGKEFACYKDIEASYEGVKIYFAHAFRAGERGSNENSNGLLREFFPKSTDFSRITQEEVAAVLRLMNFRPRKTLNWQTPAEIFLREVLHFT